MRKAIITLKDGRQFEYESRYICSYEEKLNDNRTPFIEIGNFIFLKSEILMIELVDVTEGEKENGTN